MLEYRAYNKKKKIMCYANEDNEQYVFAGSKVQIVNSILDIINSDYEFEQYTNFKDKSNKKIFENDILYVKCYNSNYDYICFTGKVKMLTGSWCVCGQYLYTLYELQSQGYEFEVVGNIHQRNRKKMK